MDIGLAITVTKKTAEISGNVSIVVRREVRRWNFTLHLGKLMSPVRARLNHGGQTGFAHTAIAAVKRQVF